MCYNSFVVSLEMNVYNYSRTYVITEFLNQKLKVLALHCYKTSEKQLLARRTSTSQMLLSPYNYYLTQRMYDARFLCCRLYEIWVLLLSPVYVLIFVFFSCSILQMFDMIICYLTHILYFSNVKSKIIIFSVVMSSVPWHYATLATTVWSPAWLAQRRPY